jgi:cysteine desulfuration protein SufE
MTDLPAALAGIVEDFRALTERERLELLLEFSDNLPALPPRYADHPELLEPVPECQSALFLAVELADAAPTAKSIVRVFFSAPPEAPTTRGFAGILHEALDGLTAAEVLAVPPDVPDRLGLANAVSPLRLRGMSAMLSRVKRQIERALRA